MLSIRGCPLTTVISALACGVAVILWPVSHYLPWVDWDRVSQRPIVPHAIQLTPTYQCAFHRGRIWFFSNEVPYTGSLLYLGGGEGDRLAYDGGVAEYREDWRWEWGDYNALQESYFDIHSQRMAGRDLSVYAPGISFRSFDWPQHGKPWRTLRVTLWIPILSLSVLPIRWGIWRLWHRWKGRVTPDIPGVAQHETRRSTPATEE